MSLVTSLVTILVDTGSRVVSPTFFRQTNLLCCRQDDQHHHQSPFIQQQKLSTSRYHRSWSPTSLPSRLPTLLWHSMHLLYRRNTGHWCCPGSCGGWFMPKNDISLACTFIKLSDHMFAIYPRPKTTHLRRTSGRWQLRFGKHVLPPSSNRTCHGSLIYRGHRC